MRADLPPGHLNLGVALTKLGQTGEAIAHLRRALELQPGYFEAHCGLGNALLAERRYAEARAVFEEAARLRPIRVWRGIPSDWPRRSWANWTPRRPAIEKRYA